MYYVHKKMTLINNIGKNLRESLSAHIKSGSKLSIAVFCFSNYAFPELRAALLSKEIKSTDKARYHDVTYYQNSEYYKQSLT